MSSCPGSGAYPVQLYGKGKGGRYKHASRRWEKCPTCRRYYVTTDQGKMPKHERKS